MARLKFFSFPLAPSLKSLPITGIEHYCAYVRNVCSKVKHFRTHSMTVVSFGEIRLVVVEPIYYMRGRCCVQGQNNLAWNLLNLTENIFMPRKDTKMYHWVNSSLLPKDTAYNSKKTWIFSNTAIKAPSLERWQLGFHGSVSLPLMLMWTHSCGQLWHSKMLLLPYLTACCHRSHC